MFEIDKQFCITTTEKLLYNIWQELKGPTEPAKPNSFDGLKRNELMALVKNLPVKPDSWSKLGNEQLKELLKEGA